jgi:hypothetical protein
MNTKKSLNCTFETLAWGALFIWWGLTELIPSLPAGAGMIGIGLILLGLNLARITKGISVSGFSITLGFLACLWGGLELAGALLRMPFDIPVFAFLLIVLGAFVIVPELTKYYNQKQEA